MNSLPNSLPTSTLAKTRFALQFCWAVPTEVSRKRLGEGESGEGEGAA